MIFDVMFIEFYAMCNFGYADAFVSGMHGCKLFIAHLYRAETQAIISNFFVMTAICTAGHKIGNNTCFGIAFVKAFLKINKFFAFEVNAV